MFFSQRHSLYFFNHIEFEPETLSPLAIKLTAQPSRSIKKIAHPIDTASLIPNDAKVAPTFCNISFRLRSS